MPETDEIFPDLIAKKIFCPNRPTKDCAILTWAALSVLFIIGLQAMLT